MGGRFDAVIFDLDGVLIDSERIHLDTWNKVLSEYGCPAPGDLACRFTGVADDKMAPVLIKELELAVSAETLLEKKRSLFLESFSGVRSFPGVAEKIGLLNWLPLGVVTTSFRTAATGLLTEAGLIENFDVIVCGDDVVRKKPDPEPYRKACELLDTAPERVVVIEDSASGAASAKSAGAYVIAVMTTTDRERLSGADRITPSTGEAIDAIIGMMKE